jgi:peptidoglycan-associated lipoprotein
MKNVTKTLVVCVFLAACSSTKPPQQDAVSTDNTQHNNSESLSVGSADQGNDANLNVSATHNSVYFAFNQYDINSDYSGIVSANASYLSSNTNTTVQIEGNTDDIGSEEYNLALGQQRADVVKKALLAAGANANQIETTSNGKLKPRYSNDSDTDRAKNRRADILYQTTPPTGYSLDPQNVPVVSGNTFYNGAAVPEGVLQ